MLLLCTNRALECLHVQSHILLSISYRIITHSKHDAWSEWATCSESLDRTSSCCIGTLTPSRKKKIHGHRLDELVRSPWLRIQWGHQRILLLSSCDFDQKVTAILAQIPIHRTNEMMRTLWLPRCEGDVSCVLHFLPCSAPSPPTRFMVWFILFWGVSLSTSIHRRHHFGKKNPSSSFSRKRLSGNLLAQQYHWPPSPQHN